MPPQHGEDLPEPRTDRFDGFLCCYIRMGFCSDKKNNQLCWPIPTS